MKVNNNQFYLNSGELRNMQPGEAKLRQVAKQFESLFLQMMMKSMRATELGDDLMGNDQSKFFQQQLDNQWAVNLSQRGGLGIADLLVQQLSPSIGAKLEQYRQQGENPPAHNPLDKKI